MAPDREERGWEGLSKAEKGLWGGKKKRVGEAGRKIWIVDGQGRMEGWIEKKKWEQKGIEELRGEKGWMDDRHKEGWSELEDFCERHSEMRKR